MTRRASAALKATGRAEYASDVGLPGMLHAVLVRAAIPHGCVIGFDAAPALAMPGVVAVFGALDEAAMPGIAYAEGAAWQTPPVLSAQVLFTGQEIGVVVATHEALAREAARRVRVTYRRERARLSLAGSVAEADLVLPAETLAFGDLAAARAAAEVEIAADYATEAQHHAALEPHGCVADWQQGRLTLWDSNQGPHLIREQLARTLGLALEQLQVRADFVGGGFGSKIALKPYHVIAAVAAQRLQRPLRLFMSRREEFTASHQRAATRRHLRLGATREGRLCFIDETVNGQAGPTRLFARNAAGALNGLRLHRADAVRAVLRRVRTNTPAPIPFRGPTAAEDIFCLEQAVDELAHALAMDPLVLRRLNLAETDLPSGLPYAGKELAACYERGAQAFGWHWRPPARPGGGEGARRVRGIGMGAAAYDGTLNEDSQAEMACLQDGRLELRLGLAEFGCGADTVFAQIAGQALGLPPALIHTRLGDSELPRTLDSSNHSRTTTVAGPAVHSAALALREALQRAAAPLLGADATTLALRAPVAGPPGSGVRIETRSGPPRALALAELVARHGPIVARGARPRVAEQVFPAMFAAHFVEVEVDLELGRVRVLRAVCAHDSGRIVNQRLAAGQVHGGFLQGLGMALQEERVLDPRDGRPLNASLWAYRAPGILDGPRELAFIDAGGFDGANALGIKGIGEPPLIAAGAAIANAVFNASGVRVRHYPITPERLLAALAALAGAGTGAAP